MKQKPQDDCKEPQEKDSTENSQKECSRKLKPQVCMTMHHGEKANFFRIQGSFTRRPEFSRNKFFYCQSPLEKEQIAICNYLDEKIEKFELLKKKLEKQISTLEQYRKSLIHECVTDKRRITEDDVQGQL